MSPDLQPELDETLMKQIDGMDYETMLRRWRFTPTGDPLFTGQVGAYFVQAMKRKREEVGDAEHTRASKAIGW